MVTAQILTQRPFSLNDGSRYLVVANIKNIPHTFNRTYKNKPIFSKNLYESKTYKDMKTLEKVLYMFEAYDYEIYQVKELFDPRYVVKYIKREFYLEPKIECGARWSLKEAPLANSYLSYIEAQDVLNKYKCRIYEYHHTKMMEVGAIQLVEIKTGAEDKNP